MKKMMTYAMVGLMVLGMAGCGKTAAPENKETKTVTGTENKTEGKSIGSFDTVDIYGEEFTEAVFEQADLTVLNCWGTFCGPCIEEMPELGEWAKEMPDNVQIIGLVTDVNGKEDEEELEAARDIVEKTDASFTHLILEKGSFSSISSKLFAVPTTYFVDREGYIVGDPVIGADVDAYKKRVENYLNQK